jgi:ketosteroid isomerase-like protein
MAQENVEVVRQFLVRTNERDLDAALSRVTADAELDWSVSEAPDSGVYRGRAEWRKWLTGRLDGLEDARFDVAELIDVAPDTVVVVAHLRGRGRTSGVEIAALGAGVWTLRAGQVTGITMYQTKAQALRAVGLEA